MRPRSIQVFRWRFYDPTRLGENLCGNGHADFFEVRAAATRRADRQVATGRTRRRKDALIGWPRGSKLRISDRVSQSRLGIGQSFLCRLEDHLNGGSMPEVASLGHLGLYVRDIERSKEHTSELQSRLHLVCRLLLEKKKKQHLQ